MGFSFFPTVSFWWTLFSPFISAIFQSGFSGHFASDFHSNDLLDLHSHTLASGVYSSTISFSALDNYHLKFFYLHFRALHFFLLGFKWHLLLSA